MENRTYRVVGIPPKKGKPWVFKNFFSLANAKDFAYRINKTDGYKVKIYEEYVVFRLI